MNEDDKLIEQFLSENKHEAFEMLVAKYQNRLLNISYGILHNNYDAEDAVQNVFIKVYNHLKDFNRKSSFYSWLYRITINSSYDVIRKRKGLQLFPNFVIDFKQNSQSSTQPIDNIEKDEKINEVQEALKKLPVKYRVIIILKEFENLSYKEIANIIGCRIGTVESRLFRARELLRKILKKGEE